MTVGFQTDLRPLRKRKRVGFCNRLGGERASELLPPSWGDSVRSAEWKDCVRGTRLVDVVLQDSALRSDGDRHERGLPQADHGN